MNTIHTFKLNHIICVIFICISFTLIIKHTFGTHTHTHLYIFLKHDSVKVENGCSNFLW